MATLLLIVFVCVVCVGHCPIILIMPLVFYICTTVLDSATKRSFNCPSFLLHVINNIEKCLKLCLALVNSMIITFYRHVQSVFILAGTFKCLFLTLLQVVVGFFSHYLEVVAIMRSLLSMGWLSELLNISCYFQPFWGCSKTCSHTRKRLHLMCWELQYIFMKCLFAC